ncbi:MAG TPA: DUF3616 domain-containing protein [Kiritimatiellia bacterium]|jgi:hypothetical protein|nr:DUF3616 domain-containing protein [Kiritimatiellia bacterium]HPO36730.1 DUF3616 domain-containing protein [Kiritimatiellia bacterium]HQA38331.1 DUF3616 domain-containing protein [Kiritimatiellia bacterium]HQL50817.1 DUF3616 domain-containing protein [Kiritimatiellia bacterium]HQQ91677.1 DUF3616 domain-containing protein [Kiritimatiellia bacterium]
MNVKSFCVLASLAAPAHAAPVTFTHMADASAGETAGPGMIVVANDEDNLLRVYRLPDGGAPVTAWDLAPHMALEKKSPEMDIEGSARIVDTIYWITSHAPNKTGKARPNRKRFFATRLRVEEGRPRLEPVGQPVTALLDALDRDPRYAGFGLAAAALKPPKTPGSLNIEALCETVGGGLLIGFRSPLPDGNALIAPLENPAGTVNGRPPRFGAPVLLDLGGNGIRAMVRTVEGVLILSGSALSGGEARLYAWNGRTDTPPVLRPVRFPSDTTPEGLIAIERDGVPDVLVLSDDGMRPVDGQPAKTHPDPVRRTFRGLWLSVLTSGENP